MLEQLKIESPEDKTIYMLLKCVIFHYHGLDEEERQDLERTADELDAHMEYKWALEFISDDYVSAFDRARGFLNDLIQDYPKEKRVRLINLVWQANNVKGYVTEMEATAMLKLAKDWNVQQELIALVMK